MKKIQEQDDKAILCTLNNALCMLHTWHPEKPEQVKMKKQAEAQLFSLIVHSATMLSGGEKWDDVYRYLIDAGVSISEDMNREMRYIEQMDNDWE